MKRTKKKTQSFEHSRKHPVDALGRLAEMKKTDPRRYDELVTLLALVVDLVAGGQLEGWAS